MPVSGAKNSALKLMAATLLAPGKTTLQNVPDISDVHVMGKVLKGMGATIDVLDEHTLEIDTSQVDSWEAPYELVAKMRASTAVMGPLLGRFHRAKIAMPGGCNLGARKIDMHILGLEALGVEFDTAHGYINANAPQGLRGTTVTLEFASVGATENLIMASVRAQGTTVIDNAAREPEVVDLCDCLNAMGAHITGAGTPVISIEGVERLHGAEHTVIADRIEAGSFLVAGVVTQGDVLVTHCQPSQMEVVLDKLRATGAVLDIGADWVRVRMTGRPKPVSIRTVPHPGFPTDMQAQFMTLNCFAEGTANITETIFENRFMHVPELCRMGAHITIEGHTAIVEGVAQLTGTTIMATDLRASASLVIAALAAQGSSTVDRIYHLDRGYERMEEKLRALGADIVRIDV